MAATTTEEDTETSADPAVAWLTEKAKQFSDDADELRATTDRAAKGLSALATAGLTAVGIAKVGEIHPDPDHGTVAVLWSGFALMVIASIAFVIRFWRANRPLALSARLADMWKWINQDDGEPKKPKGMWLKRLEWSFTGGGPDVDLRECVEIDRIYKDAMKHAPFANGSHESLESYEKRADKLEQDALYTPDSPISHRRMVQVARMRAEIEKAEERAKLVVVRLRMNQVFNRPWAVLLALMFVGGLVMFASAADSLEADRDDEVATVKSCAEAIRAAAPNATALPKVCEKLITPTPTATTQAP